MSARTFGISVVVPTFNRSEVRRAIESVASQNPGDVEILVIDDGSEVDLRGLLPQYNSHSIKVRTYRLESNRGPQAARNLGIRRASFQYVAFLDSDDEFHRDKVDRLLEHLGNGDIDVLYHAAAGLEKYNMLGRIWRTKLHRLVPFQWWAAVFNPVGTPTLVVRRRTRLGLPRLRHCEDYCFLLRYCGPGVKVEYLDELLATVHRRPGTAGGLSGALWSMRKGEFAARMVLLKDANPSSVLRFLLGAAFGCLRIGADVVRLRYWR
jgi:glycosyltransferase involved in cell wall biosynthesis